jgi:hypothetical protein
VFVVGERWEARREGSRREKEMRGGERETEASEDSVAPWLCAGGVSDAATPSSAAFGVVVEAGMWEEMTATG